MQSKIETTCMRDTLVCNTYILFSANSSYHNSPLHSGSNVPVINVKNGGSHEGLGVERSVDSLLYELENTVPRSVG